MSDPHYYPTGALPHPDAPKPKHTVRNMLIAAVSLVIVAVGCTSIATGNTASAPTPTATVTVTPEAQPQATTQNATSRSYGNLVEGADDLESLKIITYAIEPAQIRETQRAWRTLTTPAQRASGVAAFKANLDAGVSSAVVAEYLDWLVEQSF